MRKPASRKLLARHGRRGMFVRVFLERGHELVRVQWKDDGGKLQTKSWPNTPENRETAHSFAEGTAALLARGDAPVRERLSLAQLWGRYAVAEFPHLRPRSRTLYREGFRRWEVMWGPEFLADRTTPEMADEFRVALTKQGLAIKTVRQSLDDVKRVFAWAEARDLIQRNRLRLYRLQVAKEERPAPRAEYRADEFLKLLGALSPDNARQWRAWVALTLCGVQGARQNAVLHLSLDDIDLVDRIITWRRQWDKTGKEWQQPLRERAAQAVLVALRWREKLGYEGRWLIFAASSKNQSEVYTAQSLWAALRRAERKAGIPTIKGRAAHGLRKMLAGDVAAMTGNALLGLRSIGDSDPRMANQYILSRNDEMRSAFDRLDAPEEIAKSATNTQPGNDEGPTPVGIGPANPSDEA